jgi:hypothetical protein
MEQHESLLASQGLPSMVPSARSQFRAICYRQTSARIGHAVAKASVMRLLGAPRLPLPRLIPSYALARNRAGPADSFSPPFPLTESHLCFLPWLPPLSFVPILFLCPFSRNFSLFLDALSFLLRALLALALICNELLCVYL